GGIEWQWGNASINNYGNRQGLKDTVQSLDKLEVRQWFPFIQAEWQLKKRLLVQAGASTNAYQYKYRTLSGNDNTKRTKKFEEQFLPRFAILYPFKKYVTAYASLSKGYSPATLAEIRASDANINTSLQPEFGWNYEVGARLNSANKLFELDVTAYYFKLQQAIVRRNNSAGQEYFINAGGTDQKGIELRGSWL
ncbi:MAG TPA: TonB-dependent receptor, partial [Chitinophagaceae bacterium]|nr:TonB-dependent receptor [Chitinophagaceae bacterium]